MRRRRSRFRRFWKEYINPFSGRQILGLLGIAVLLAAICVGLLRLLYGHVILSPLILEITVVGALVASLILERKKRVSAQYREQSITHKIRNCIAVFFVFAIGIASILGYADIHIGQKRTLKPCQRTIEWIGCSNSMRGPSTCKIRVLNLNGSEGRTHLHFSPELESWLEEGALVELSFARYPLGTLQLESILPITPNLSKKNLLRQSCFEEANDNKHGQEET